MKEMRSSSSTGFQQQAIGLPIALQAVGIQCKIYFPVERFEAVSSGEILGP